MDPNQQVPAGETSRAAAAAAAGGNAAINLKDPPQNRGEYRNRRQQGIDAVAILPTLSLSLLSMITRGNTENPAVPQNPAETLALMVEADSRSIFVSNVAYACTLEAVLQHFKPCGTVNRITMAADESGQPKGFAYVEFWKFDTVQKALLLNKSVLHGRQLKVSAKRTNIWVKQYRPLRRRYMASQSTWEPYMPSFYSSYSKAAKFRAPWRFRPY